MSIKAIVTDIEGTTTDIAFVHNVLFPYSRKRMATFIRDHHADAAVAPHITSVAEQAGVEPSNLDGISDALLHWIDTDQKVGALKAIQGMQWAQGFEVGDFKGHIYPDAHQQLQQWASKGVPLYVYSSGSVQAQKLLYGYSDFGDLNPLFRGNFDTAVGGKKESSSYANIAKQISLSGEQLLFLSDIEAELDAAREAGWHTAWLVRDREAIDADAAHKQFLDFNGLDDYIKRLG